ncbi:MAG: nitrate- and nitrite sensing domain-containing protein [Candidatus Paceibacteria bacterium]
MLLLKLKRLSIESKLKILAIFPLIFIIGLSFFMIYDSYEKDLKLKNVEKLLILNTKISLLLHETQKERGLSVAYLESKNDTFKKNLLNQRELTNNKIDEFKTYLVDFSYYPNQGKINIENVLKELSKIENIRNEINELKVKSKNVISYYSNLNSSLLSFVANSSYIAENEKIINNLTAYYNFLMAKERAGLERAMGSNTFTNKTFGEGMFLNFLSLINEQTVFMENFYIYGFDYEEFVKEKMQNSSVKEVQKMRDILLSYGENKNVIFDIEASYWFKTISEKINILKEIDDYISKDMIEQINIIKKINLIK